MAKATKVIRVDRLDQCANTGKQAALKAVVTEWRVQAQILANEQWFLWQYTGQCNKMHGRKYPDSPLGAARVQMCRHQVVGVIDGHLASLVYQFKSMVAQSSLTTEQKHRLYRINKARAWQHRLPPTFKTAPFVYENDLRLARTLFRRLLKTHRKPSFRFINLVMDERAVKCAKASDSKVVDYWLTLPTLERDGRQFRKIAVPLKSNDFAEGRKGQRLTTWQMNLNKDGILNFGRLTDVKKPFEQSVETYQVRTPVLALDWGMNTLFASSEGDLLGRGTLDKISVLDKTICAIARGQQRHGLKPRDSARYCAKVSAMRGYLKTEVNRIFNRLVATRAPGHLVVEKLDFRNPNLSKRMNRLISNFGRGVIKDKLADLGSKYGITHEEVNPAYTSQECHNTACGYVDRRNRDGQQFQCRACGKQQHADVKAAKTLRHRCSDDALKPLHGRTAILDVMVRRYLERFDRPRWSALSRPRSRGAALDPRLSNPHFADWTAKARSLHGL